MSYSLLYGCSEDLGIHYCDPCLSDREFARTRSGGFIKKAYLATLLANPTDITLWQAGIASGDIIMIPETSGSYDPGNPQVLKGYGERKETYGPREQTLIINDPNYVANYAFYNNIGNQQDLVPFYRTSSLVHIFDTVASIVAKDTIADDIAGEVIWEVTCKVTSINLPTKHTIASINSIFVCTSF